jgi:small subunit ribosomal protein S21
MASRPELENIKQRGFFVEVHNNDVNKALRKMKKMLQQDGIFQLLRERERFEQPSMKRKKAKARATKRWQKKLRELKTLGIAN